MRRRSRRHLEIFSISALDLFASALGAFILVTMILFPYYSEGRTAAETLGEKDADLRSLNDRLQEASQKLASLEVGQAQAPAPQRPPFLIVEIRWGTIGADVDLHVTDPAGHEFWWYRSNQGGHDYPGSAGELSIDMTDGPALELWQDAKAEPGRYRIDYVANAMAPGVVVPVSGSVFDRTGRHDLQPQVLRTARERVQAATITVGADGHVALQ